MTYDKMNLLFRFTAHHKMGRIRQLTRRKSMKQVWNMTQVWNKNQLLVKDTFLGQNWIVVWTKMNDKKAWKTLGKPIMITINSFTVNDNDVLSYSLTTMMCFLRKEWYDFFSAYTANLFIKAYHRITYKKDLKIT